MTTTPQGGAAFPLYTPIEGMTLRDYFAAHAPETPDWFKVNPPPYTGAPDPTLDELDETHRATAEAWRRDSCFDLPEEIAWWGEKVERWRKDREDWRDACWLAVKATWRFAWADAMLKARGAE